MRNIQFLESPEQFYTFLLSLVRAAQRNISLATLYIGSGKQELELLKSIQQLPGEVEVNLLVDGLRGNRKGLNGPIKFIREHCPRAQVREYVSRHYAGLAKLLPDRIREIVGTQHMKIVAVDNTVIITGANLSDIYFTNRQDRYMVVHDCGKLAEHLHRIVQDVPGTATHGEYTLDGDETILKFATHRENESDEVVLSLLNNTEADSTIHVCSPYLNLSPEILHGLEKFAHVKIITGSIESNGFHKSKGLSSLIPDAYEIIKAEAGKKFELYEYARAGWTFHPKGIWVTPRGSDTPIAIVIGSSNFSHRSFVRDVEISFSLISRNDQVRRRMQQELDGILRHVRQPSYTRNHRSILRYLVKGPLRTFL